MARVLIPPIAHPPSRPRGAVVRALSGQSMGTSWSVRIAAADIQLDVAHAAVQGALDRVEAQMSPWRTDSALSVFNRAPADSAHTLPEEMAAVVGLAFRIACETEGAFDPTLGRLTDLWGFGPALFAGGPPDAAALADARDEAGWRRLRFEAERLVQPGGLCLDLCGIAKGHAVDRAAEALEALGVGSYLIEVGGEVRGAGVKPDTQPWWVALEHPPSDAPEGLLIAACGIAIATSGGDRRHFEHQGRRYSHTLDARSGEPVRETVLAATVLHPCCAAADALATALIVMGAERAGAFAEAQSLAAVLTLADAAGPRRVLSPAAEAMALED